MGFALRLCLLLLVSEICVRANPVIHQTGLSHELAVPKSTNRQLFMMEDPTTEEPGTAASDTAAPGTTPSDGGQTTAAPKSRSSVRTPSIILCVIALMPVFVLNKLGNH